MWPLPPAEPSGAPTPKVKVCDICGDAGFDEMLTFCIRCNDRAEHLYCMQTILDTVPSNWVCEQCKLKECEDNREKRLTCVDLEGHKSKRACLNRIELTAVSEKMGSMQGTAVISPSKKRPAENAADCGISKKHASEPTGILAGNHSMSAKSPSAALDLSITKSRFQSEALQKGQHANEPTSIFAGNHSMSAKSPSAALDLSKSKSQFQSEALQNGYSSPSTVAGDQSSDGTQSVRTSKLPSGSTSGRLTDGQPVQRLETSLKTESLSHTGFSTKKQTGSPIHCFKKPCSSKIDDDLSFLLPSRPKSLIRTGSARSASVGLGFKTIKVSNQPNNMAKATMIDRTKDAELKGLKKTTTMKSKLAGSKTVLVANTGLFKSLQGRREDVTGKIGIGSLRNNAIKTNAKRSKFVEVKKLFPLGTLRCDRCKETGHSSNACTTIQLNEVSEVKTCSSQRAANINDKSVGSGPLAQVQTSKLAHGSQGEPSESTDKLQSTNEVKFLRKRSNLEACGNNSMVNSQSLKQVSKPSFHNENMKKQRFVAEVRKKWEAEVKLTGPPTHLNPLFCFPHSHEGNEQFRPSCSRPEEQGGPSLASSQLPPGNISASQIPTGMGMPFQSLHKTGLGIVSQVPHHEYFSPEVCAIPDTQILWRGCFKVSSSTCKATYYRGMQAHPSNRANPKVWEAASALPDQLEVEELPRGVQNDSWPRSFQEFPPTSNSIGIFIFPVDMTSHDTSYKPLLDRMISCDLALKVSLEFTQLLVFPSHLLPEADQCWDDMKYLWGVFRANKGKVHQTRNIESPPVVTTELIPPPDGCDLGSPNCVGDVIDLDIGMKDGTDVIAALKSVDSVFLESETCGIRIHEQTFPLTPGSLTLQPSKKQAISQSLQDNSHSSSEHFLDLPKDELPAEQDKCVENTHSTYGKKGETLPQDSSCRSEVNQPVDTSIKEMLNELSPVPNIMPIKLKNLTCSRSSELQEIEDIVSDTVSQGVFCQQQESRDPVMSKEVKIFHAVSLGSGERTKWSCTEKIKIEHFTHTDKEDNDIVELKREKWNFNSKTTDKMKEELDGNDDFQENQQHFCTEMQKCGGAQLQREQQCSHRTKHLCSSTMSNSVSSSCPLSGLSSCSPRRLELIEKSMLVEKAHEGTKCRRQDSSPSSSGSVATGNCQASSRVNRMSADGACNTLQTSERNSKTETPLRLMDSGSSGPKNENTTKSQLCYPETVEWTDTAPQDFEPSLTGQSFPCLPFFPRGESCTEFDTTGIIGGIVVDQEGSGNDQRSQSASFIEQLDRPLYSSLNTLRVYTKSEPSRRPLPGQAVDGLPESDLKLALSIPPYRKEGNTWVRIEEDPLLCFDGQVDLSLSLQ